MTDPFVVVGNVPVPLQRRLEDLLTQSGVSLNKYEIFLRGTSNLTIEEWGEIHTIYVATSITDPVSDAKILDILASPTFRNEVLYFYKKDEICRVRILHNPEGLTLKATQLFRLEPWRSPQRMTITWNRKYGILSEEKVPSELI